MLWFTSYARHIPCPSTLSPLSPLTQPVSQYPPSIAVADLRCRSPMQISAACCCSSQATTTAYPTTLIYPSISTTATTTSAAIPAHSCGAAVHFCSHLTTSLSLVDICSDGRICRALSLHPAFRYAGRSPPFVCVSSLYLSFCLFLSMFSSMRSSLQISYFDLRFRLVSIRFASDLRSLLFAICTRPIPIRVP